MLYCPHKQVLQCVADLELDIGLYFPRSVPSLYAKLSSLLDEAGAVAVSH